LFQVLRVAGIGDGQLNVSGIFLFGGGGGGGDFFPGGLPGDSKLDLDIVWDLGISILTLLCGPFRAVPSSCALWGDRRGHSL